MSTEDDRPAGPVAGEGVTEEPGGEPALTEAGPAPAEAGPPEA